MDMQSQPLVRTDSANAWLTAFLVIAGLIILVFGNNKMTEGWYIAGTHVDAALNSVGLAILIAAITQFYTDFRVRSRFYQDVSDNIIANQTLRDSGILKFFRDSKLCLPAGLIEHCRNLDVGVTYSDRLLKDNLGLLTANGNKVNIRLFCLDGNDANVRKLVQLNTGLNDAEILAEFAKLDRIVQTLREDGVNVEVYRQKTLPHYSFYVIDNVHFFITLSTFSSRRASVPLFQAAQTSPLARLVLDDIKQVTAFTAPDIGP